MVAQYVTMVAMYLNTVCNYDLMKKQSETKKSCLNDPLY